MSVTLWTRQHLSKHCCRLLCSGSPEAFPRGTISSGRWDIWPLVLLKYLGPSDSDRITCRAVTHLCCFFTQILPLWFLCQLCDLLHPQRHWVQHYSAHSSAPRISLTRQSKLEFKTLDIRWQQHGCGEETKEKKNHGGLFL